MEELSLTKIQKTKNEIIFTILRQKSYLELYKKYSSGNFTYSSICINNIIFNEPSLIVAKFKDYLIFDDNTEFLRRYYNFKDIYHKLYRILDLYENYSKIFPNYLVIKEKKYMYKNIRKKQKMIDAFNQIKIEEEENRRKIKENQEENEINDINNDNQLFTDLVKDEIKLFQKDNNMKYNNNSFNNESDKDNTNTMFGLSHSSISINLINKNKNQLLLSPKENKRMSFDSKNNETDGTISCLLNVMNDSKIYSKDLLNIFKINNNYKNNNRNKKNIKEKQISFNKNKKNTNKEKLNDIKNIIINDNNGNNITNNINNNIKLYNNILTPEKLKKEVNKLKNNIHFNSTLLSKKRIKMLNPSLFKTNSNSINNKKIFPHKQSIYIPSISNTIININNNFFSHTSRTERLEYQKINKLPKKNIIQNSLKNKDNENEFINNKLLLINHKNSLNNKFDFNKYKKICKDFSWKKKLNIKNNNKIDKEQLIIKERKELSPQLELKIDLMKNKIINVKNTTSARGTVTKKDEIIKKMLKKPNQKIKKNKTDNKINNNAKILTFKNNQRLSTHEYSLLSFINKTESNLKEKILITNNNNNLKDRQKTCINFLKTKTFKKDIILKDKLFTTIKKDKKNNLFKGNKDVIFYKHNSNKTSKSKSNDKNKHFKNFHLIKKKILSSETKVPTKKFISNYINKTQFKNNKKSLDKNNIFIAYSTINGNKLNNKNNILLDSKSIEKMKKCESIDFSNHELHHKNIFSKIDSIKRNSYIYSPKNSFSHFRKSNDKKNNIINDYYTERSFLINQSVIPKQNTSKINQCENEELRNEYKTILLTKNNKKSYDINLDCQKRYKQNFVNSLNNLKNKNYNISGIRKNFFSFDLNGINNNNTNCYCNSVKNKSIENNENNKGSFKKIFNLKNGKKNNEKITKNDNNPINSLLATIRVNTCNFLSKRKKKKNI